MIRSGRPALGCSPDGRGWFALVCVCLLWLGCESRDAFSVLPEDGRSSNALWISRDEIAALPTEGPAWEALVAEAKKPVPFPDLSDQDDPSNVRVLAKALYAVRTGDRRIAESVREACRQVQGTEKGATALAVSRELLAYVIAADVVGLDEEDRKGFEQWLRTLQNRSFGGRTIRSTHEDRPNNWGTHAGASRIAVALYLEDHEEVLRAAHVLAGWLGEAEGWQGFDFGAADWQPKGLGRRYAVNPVGAAREGHSIDGVLPDDQRRGGAFTWPPPKENYVYEALQGVVVQSRLLERAGFRPWGWGDRAILRAMHWLQDEAKFPAEGDDTWIPYLVNRAYGSSFPTSLPSRPGKGMGFTDWTHARP